MPALPHRILVNFTHYTCMHTGTTFYIKNQNKHKTKQNHWCGREACSRFSDSGKERKKAQTKKREYMGTEE